MTGLDKIKDQILAEARKQAASITQDAQNKAEGFLKAAQTEAAKIAEKAEDKSMADISNYHDRIKSSCDLKRRTMILNKKQEIIADVIEKAYRKLEQADDKTRFSNMEKLLRQSVQKGEGKMLLSAKDMECMPAGFEKTVSEIAAAKGGSLTIEKAERPLDGGFVLVYGGIEENCTWKALFDANKEQLQDLVHGYLWRDENG